MKYLSIKEFIQRYGKMGLILCFGQAFFLLVIIVFNTIAIINHLPSVCYLNKVSHVTSISYTLICLVFLYYTITSFFNRIGVLFNICLVVNFFLLLAFVFKLSVSCV